MVQAPFGAEVPKWLLMHLVDAVAAVEGILREGDVWPLLLPSPRNGPSQVCTVYFAGADLRISALGPTARLGG